MLNHDDAMPVPATGDLTDAELEAVAAGKDMAGMGGGGGRGNGPGGTSWRYLGWSFRQEGGWKHRGWGFW